MILFMAASTKQPFFIQNLIFRKHWFLKSVGSLQRQKLILEMKLRLSLVVFICVHFVCASQTISDTSFGKGLLNFVAKDSSFSVKFAPRIQARFIGTTNYIDNQYNTPEYNFLIRRARLKFDGFAFSPKLKYKIELGLSNRDISGGNEFTRNTPRYILDAVIMWNFFENFELWAGQTKLPGNVERVISSANLQLVDRSLLNSRFNIDRDMGVQLRHKTYLSSRFFIREKLSISQGEGRNVTEGNQGGLQYTGRLELLPFGEFTSNGDYVQSDLKREKIPKLMLGFTYNFNNDGVRERNNLGSYIYRSDGSLYQTDMTTIFADLMFKYQGFSLMSEYAERSAENPIAIDLDGLPTGDVVLEGDAFNIQAGYLFKNNYEIVGRFTNVNYAPSANRQNQEEYTLGLNKFVVGHKLKVQSDVSYRSLGGEKDAITMRIGFDLHF